MYECSWYDLV